MVLARYRYYRPVIFPVPVPRSVFSKIIRYRVARVGLSALSASEREKTAAALMLVAEVAMEGRQDN